MNLGPSALIIGIDHFVARKLEMELLNKDIKVVGLGEEESLDEVEDKFNYVFDFRGDEEITRRGQSIGEKFILVEVNKEIENKRIKNTDLNWRIVKAFGVYGSGMDESGFLAGAIKQAVLNKNLILPPIGVNFRILNVDDLVEAILRASFLSGTEKEELLVVGEEISSEEVARILIDEAKMTKFQVIQHDFEIDNLNEKEILENRKKLRWQPVVSFKEGIKETLQYFFSVVDEENRKKKLETKYIKIKKVEVVEEIVKEPEINKRIFDVIVEEAEEKPEVIKEIEKEKIEEEVFKIEKIEIIRENSRDKEEDEEIVEEMEEVEEKRSQISNLKSEEEKEIKETPKKGFKKRYWVGGILGIIFAGLLMLPLYWGITSYVTVQKIKAVGDLIKNKQYKSALVLAEKYEEKVKGIDNKISDWGLNKISFFRNYQMGLRVAENVLTIEKKGIVLAESGGLIDEAILKDKNINWESELKKIDDGLLEINTEIGVLQARLSGDWSFLPGRWKGNLVSGNKKLDKIKAEIELGKNGIKILPEFLGLDGKRRDYLVLLQNETELRPGGGFIGSYGILSFEKGKLLNFEIKDIYEADGQLIGHVEPPPEISSYLGEGGWFMRDANWKANFVSASNDLKWFLDKETNRKVDGVIGINLASAKAVLGVIGEVYVPDFKEKINKDNLYEQAEFYAETKFFPGSNQKASFLGGLGKQMFEDIKSLKSDKKLSFIETIIDLLERNEIQLALNEKETAKKINKLGWDGSIYQGKCGMEKCFTDYLYLVEANLGVNKANYFLYRNIEQTIDISTNSISRIVKVSYENTAKNTNWPGGDYKNYLRVYIPVDANLAEVSVADGLSPSTKKTYSMEELKIRESDGKKEIGFLVNVPVLSKKIVEIRYSNNIDLSKQDKLSYVHYTQKQSGFGDTGLVTLVSIPPGWEPSQVQPAATLVEGKLLFNQRLDRDIKMGIEINK